MASHPETAQEAFDDAKHAAQRGDLAGLEEALKAWPEIGRMTDFASGHATLLLIAAASGDPMAFSALLSVSDPCARDSEGNTAFILAAMSHRQSVEAARLALAGCSGREANNDGEDALIASLRARRESGTSREMIAFLASVCDPAQTNARNGEDALMFAALGGPRCVENVKILLETHEPSRLNRPAMGALGIAALNRQAEAFFLIWERLGAEARAQQGRSAFDIARGGREPQWPLVDALAEFAVPAHAAALFSRGGPEKMPRWAALCESRILAQELVAGAKQNNELGLAPAAPSRRL